MTDISQPATDNFKHLLFYWSCLIAAIDLVAIAILEAQPNIIEQLLQSVYLVDAVIFAAFGFWSRTGKVSAPFILFPYCIYLIYDQTMTNPLYYYAALGVYVSVMITAAMSLYASWQTARQT
jgi:hypothetical protein